MLTAQEKSNFARWQIKVRHAIALCEKNQYYETLEIAKALALFVERQAEAREKYDVTGLTPAMERAFNLRLARLVNAYRREKDTK